MVGLIMREELLKEYLIEKGFDCIRIIRYYDEPYVEFTVAFRGDFNTGVKHIYKIDYERFEDWCKEKRDCKLNQLL